MKIPAFTIVVLLAVSLLGGIAPHAGVAAQDAATNEPTPAPLEATPNDAEDPEIQTCKAACLVATTLGCGSIIAACITGTVVTIGGAYLPCRLAIRAGCGATADAEEACNTACSK